MAHPEISPSEAKASPERDPRPTQVEHSPELTQERTMETEQSRNPERVINDARHEIERIHAERDPQKTERPAANKPEKKLDSKHARDQAYAAIMQQAQAEMSAPARVFSKIIHAPVIDALSTATAKTIARPNAILAGSAFAFFLTLAIYVTAKINGYSLSGTETIAAFIIGWLLGNLFDFFRTALRGSK